MYSTRTYYNLLVFEQTSRPNQISLSEATSRLGIPYVQSYVVLGELRAGCAHGRRTAENERILRCVLLKDGVRVLFVDDQTTHHYAAVFRQLRKQGTPIPTNDMWLAALLLQHNLALHARDRHFEHLPQLVRVRPAERRFTVPGSFRLERFLV